MYGNNIRKIELGCGAGISDGKIIKTPVTNR
jgi:hypothetical protein